MSTPEFLTAYRKGNRSVIGLVRIQFGYYDNTFTRTLYLATAEVNTPTGAIPVDIFGSLNPTTWQNIIAEVGPISCPGKFLSSDVDLCTCPIKIARGRFGYQAAGKTVLDSLIDNKWDGSAAVTIWRWVPGMSVFDSADCIFTRGQIIECVADDSGISLLCQQRTTWNRPVPNRLATRERYSQIPEDSANLPLPVCYGYGADMEPRAPILPISMGADGFAPDFPLSSSNGDSPAMYYSQIRGPRRVSRGLLVDTGRGSGIVNAKAKLVVAGHVCYAPPLFQNGTGIYFEQDGWLAALTLSSTINAAAPGETVFGEMGGLIDDNAEVAWVSVPPNDFDPVANTCEWPRAVLDPENEYGYAHFDWTAGLKTLRLRFPSPPASLGEATRVHPFICYRSPAHTNFKMRVTNHLKGGSGVCGSAERIVPVSATPLIYVFMGLQDTTPGKPIQWSQSPATYSPGGPWAFGEWEMEIGWPTSTPVTTGTGTGDLFFAGLLVRFRPKQRIVYTAKKISVTRTRPSTPAEVFGHGRPFTTFTSEETIPATTEFDSRIYANVLGHRDIGTAFANLSVNALLQRLPDIVCHLLAIYGNENLSIGAFNNTTGVPGSFIDARAALLNSLGTDLTYSISVDEMVDVRTMLTWLCASAAVWPIMDPHDGLWRLFVWREGMPVDYPWKFSRDQVWDVEVERRNSSDVASGVRVAYNWDARGSSYKSECFVSSDPTYPPNGRSSSAGYKYRNLRDQLLHVQNDGVANINDKIDITGGVTLTLPIGSYTGASMLAQLRTSFGTSSLAREEWGLAYGFLIVAGINDKLEFFDGAGKIVTLTPGLYATGAALATHAQIKMNSVSSGISVFYSPNGRFQFSRATTLDLLFGVGRQDSCCAAFGFSKTTITGSNAYASDNRMQPELFAIAHCDPLTGVKGLLWETGPNGVLGTNQSAAEVLGYDRTRDSFGVAGVYGLSSGFMPAICPKGNRESLIEGASKRDLQIEGRAIVLTDVALELRNRIVALGCKFRHEIRFSTSMAPDLDRGRVIEFDGDMDQSRPYPAYGSNGSWAGKKFIVTSVVHSLERQSIVAMEV